MNEFRGHVEECLKHFTVRFLQAFPKGSRKAGKAKVPMAKFCGVSPETVTGWFHRGINIPRGDILIKLMCYLEVNGYKVIEMENMDQKCRNFSRLIGHNLITVGQALEILRYTETSTLYAMLRGSVGASEERQQKLWDMWKARKDKLDEAIENASRQLKLGVPLQRSLESSSLLQTGEVQTSGCPKDGVVDIMHGLLKIFDSGFMQSLTEADWTALRSSNSNTILRLSSHLSNISAKLMGQG